MPKAFFYHCVVLAGAAIGLAGCTVKQTETPDLAGPSEYAMSFNVTASPDAISQDGGSTSSIVVSAFDAHGKPRVSQTFRLDMMVDGRPTDYGTLSTKTIVSNAEGKASALYTAPPAIPTGATLPTCSASIFSSALPGGCVEIVATPIGSSFTSNITQSVQIRLVPLGVVQPPAPTASFTFTPSSPAANLPVQFDASASCPGPAGASGCLSSASAIVSYAWDFGDGGTASGKTVSHSFGLARTYSVTLTVTTEQGVRSSQTKTVTVGAGTAPTALFVFSPTPAVVRGEVYFDASNSRPGPGHTIVEYRWNWGDGDPVVSSGSPLQDHDFSAVGSYTVLLTVVDESGQIGTTTQTVSVTLGTPGAIFTMSPSPATVGSPVTFNGVGSSSTSPIARYEWNFGDSSPIVSTNAPTTSTTHTYGGAGDYTVTLTVYDNNGISHSVSHTLKVQ